MARKRVILYSAAALLVLITVIAVVLQRQRVRRHRVFRPAAGEVQPEPLRGAIPPVDQWTEAFQQLQGEELADLLEAIEQKHPDLYKKDSLAYLHARVLVEENENAEAAAKLAPFLEQGHPFRDRALYHRASIADGAEASRYRNTLIFEHRDSMYRDEAIDEELEFSRGRPAGAERVRGKDRAVGIDRAAPRDQRADRGSDALARSRAGVAQRRDVR